MLIVKNVAVIATGNPNEGIWWVLLDKIQISKLVDFQQFFLRPIFLLCQKLSFPHSCRGQIKFQALSVLKNILFENLTLISSFFKRLNMNQYFQIFVAIDPIRIAI